MHPMVCRARECYRDWLFDYETRPRTSPTLLDLVNPASGRADSSEMLRDVSADVPKHSEQPYGGNAYIFDFVHHSRRCRRSRLTSVFSRGEADRRDGRCLHHPTCKQGS